MGIITYLTLKYQYIHHVYLYCYTEHNLYEHYISTAWSMTIYRNSVAVGFVLKALTVYK